MEDTPLPACDEELPKFLAAGPKVVKHLDFAGMQLESRSTLAAQAFVDMLDNYPGLESVSSVPVQDLKDAIRAVKKPSAIDKYGVAGEC